MDSIQFSEFSTNGINNSDTFDSWRKKTNGIIQEIDLVKDSISPLFNSTTALLKTVNLDTPQTIVGTKTFAGGSATVPLLKIDDAGLYYDSSALALSSTVALKSSKIIIDSELQLGSQRYSIPISAPSGDSLLGKSGNSLTWTSINSIVSQIQSESAVNVTTTNIVLPVGAIQAYATTGNVPSGWLICNGSRFKGSDYPELATLLLATYDKIFTSQTGQTAVSPGFEAYNPNWWYTLPDLRGRVAIGVGTQSDGITSKTFITGGTGGKYEHTLTALEIPSHTHTFIPSAVIDSPSSVGLIHSFNDVRTEMGTTYSSAGSAHSIIQPYLVTNYIIKATPDVVVNTFLDRGNVFDIIKGDQSLQSLSMTTGGTGVLNIKYDTSLSINSLRELGVATNGIISSNISANSITPNKLSSGGPSWDSSTWILYEGADTNRRRVATREYVDEKIFKTGPTKKLVNKISGCPHSSAPGFGEFCYINHEGVPVITGINNSNRFGTFDKYSHTEMPLPDNRFAEEIHVLNKSICALDNFGQLWMMGSNALNMFNIVPNPTATSLTEWNKAYNQLYVDGSKIKKIILSGDLHSENLAVIDDKNRLWVSGNGVSGQLGQGNVISTISKSLGEQASILNDVIDAIIIGSASQATCIALKSDGIYSAGYGAKGQRGDGTANAIGNTFTKITIANISNYSDCEIYGAGSIGVDATKPNNDAAAFIKTSSGLYGWGSGSSGIFGLGNTTSITAPTLVYYDPKFDIDKVYTTVSGPTTGSIYLYGQRHSTTALSGQIEETIQTNRFGKSISSSADGSIVAVGSPGNNGRVRCYSYNSTSWSLLGSEITLNISETATNFGESVSLNSSGTRLCVGAPDGHLVSGIRYGKVNIYDYSSETKSWIARNLPFTGDAGIGGASKLGSSVAISKDGNVFIAGAPGFVKNSGVNTGRVYVRRITPTGTVSVGDSIDGLAAGQKFGMKVSINGNGTIIAISSTGVDNRGTVQIYEQTINGWTQLGGDITGVNSNDDSTNISLSESGYRIIIGSTGYDSKRGYSCVFQYDSSDKVWKMLGQPIYGLTAGSESGSAVAISNDGSTIAIGAPKDDFDGMSDNGTVRLLKYENESWKPLASTFHGNIPSAFFGGAAALSADGLKLIVSSPLWSQERGRFASYSFVESGEIKVKNSVLCCGKNTKSKFGKGSDELITTWTTLGDLPSGYTLEDFWCSNGNDAASVNFVKAYNDLDKKHYLFSAGSNENCQSGIGTGKQLTVWTRLNLHSAVIEKIKDVQAVSVLVGSKALDYTILHLNDGTLYFAGHNYYMIDPNLPNFINRTDFTRIK